MATIGSLAVNIVAKTDKLTKGLQSASQKFTSFVKDIGGVQGALGALATYGFAQVINSALEAGGALFDLSERLHISTEAIGALDYAAQQIGSSTDAVHSSIGRLTKILGQASAGSTQAQAALTNLGLSYKSLLALPIEQQFLEVLDALHELPSAEMQAAAATAIFGKSYAELNPLINAGSEAIRQYGQEAANAGALISGESAAALDDAADAVAAFSTQWQALKNNMVATFAPAITGAMYLITNSLGAIRAVWYSLQGVMLTGLIAIHRGLMGLAQAMNIVLPKMAEFDIEGMRAEQDTMKRALGGIDQKIQSITGSGGNPLAAPNGRPVPVHLIKDSTSNGDTVQLGTVGLR